MKKLWVISQRKSDSYTKKVISLILLVSIVLLSYWLWLSLRPIEIVAVHKEGSHSSVLVKTFPLTDKGKINWWLNNKDMLKSKYNIPSPDTDGSFIVVFWYFGGGYKEAGKYDSRCFKDMQTKVNCIDKHKSFTVWNNPSNVVLFNVNDGAYRINDKDEMIKTEYH